MKKNVLLTGGTGFIGKYLTRLLLREGYSVSILSRKYNQNTTDVEYFLWDISKKHIDETAVLKADYIIHLAGEGIADKPWSAKRKKEILDSREHPIELLYAILKAKNKKIESFISASGIGIYGAIDGSEICTENTAATNDFLGSTCQKWEAAANQMETLGIRTVKIRTGLVLGRNEGFLKKIAPLFKLKLGSALGSGKQYMPWIHIDDLCNIYLNALQNSLITGAFNAAVNDKTTNKVFSNTLAKIYGYSLWLPAVPAFLIRFVLGEMAVIILTGRRVSSEKIEKTGFQFRYKNLEIALRDCIK
jgi:uncharacterized protein (TIGR01777 family)